MNKLYSTVKFSDIFTDIDGFKTDLKQYPIDLGLEDADISLIFYLLMTRYMNSPIAYCDINQFKFRLFGTIFTYYPEYKAKSGLQDKIRSLTDDELIKSGQTITNHANNPSRSPDTDVNEPLPYIDDQLTSNSTLNKLQAYLSQWGALDSNYTTEFIDKFKYLFARFVPMTNTFYVEEDK